MKIYSLKKELPKINALIYGDPGAGKTLLAAGAADIPEMRDVLLVNIEGGTLTIRSKDNIHAVDIGRDENGKPTGNTIKELEDITWNILTNQHGMGRFKTVIIDSVTELQTQDLEDLVTEANKKNSNRSIDDISLHEYKRDGARLKRIFRHLRDAPINLIVTALPKKIVDDPKAEKPRVVEVRPSLTQSVALSLMGYVDFVWFLYKEEQGNKRFMLTQDLGPVKAKTRNQKFHEAIGQKVENPTLPALYEQLLKAME